MTMPPIDHLARIHKAIGTRANLRLLGMLHAGPVCTHKLKVILGVPEWAIARAETVRAAARENHDHNAERR